MKYLYFLFFTLFLFSCTKEKSLSYSAVPADSISKVDKPKERNYMEEVLATLPENLTPIMGYRFFIEGDFDGDGKKEKLTEHLISTIDGKETNRLYSQIEDQAQLIALQDKKRPYCFISCSNPTIDTFALGNKGNGQLLGLLLLRNEGDLNGDGTDEISFIRYYADWSSLNSLHIITYTKTGWKELYNSICYDNDAPELYDIDIDPKDWDKLLYLNINSLKDYQSRIKKIKPKLITVKGYTLDMAAEILDTVNLNDERY